VVASLLLLSYSRPYRATANPNEWTRLYLARAMVDRQELSIDEEWGRHGPIRDWATHGGRRYTDKAPGSSLVAAAAYWSLRVFHAPGDVSMSRLARRARFLGLILPWCLLLPWWARALGRFTGDLASGRVLALAHTLATPAFTYQQQFFGHGLVAMGLAVALMAAVPRPSRWKLGLAGAAMGFAGLCEYQALPLLALFVLYAWAAQGFASAAILTLAAAPWVAALGAYNAVCFGGPFELSYEHLGPTDLAAIHATGVGGVGWRPMARGLLGVLVNPARGLLYYAPWLALAFAGIWAGVRSADRRAALLMTAVVGFSLWFGSAARTWDAGWSIGPRLLVSFLPMWVAAVALAWARWRAWVPVVFGPLLAVAVVHEVLATWIFPGYPPIFSRPLDHAALPLLREGLVAPNLASDLGMFGVASLLPGVVIVLAAFAVVAVALYRSVAWKWRITAAAATAGLLIALHLPTRPPDDYVLRDFLSTARQVRDPQP